MMIHSIAGTWFLAKGWLTKPSLWHLVGTTTTRSDGGSCSCRRVSVVFALARTFATTTTRPDSNCSQCAATTKTLLQRHVQQAVRTHLQSTYWYKSWRQQVLVKAKAQQQAKRRRIMPWTLWSSKTTTTTTSAAAATTTTTTSNHPMDSKSRNDVNTKDSSSLSSLEILARLAGFSLVDTTTPIAVPLAEGVLAQPEASTSASSRFFAKDNDMRNYRLYSTSMEENKSIIATTLSSCSLPPRLISTDITIYRILENRADQMLQRWQLYAQTWVQRSIVQPLQQWQEKLTAITAFLGASEKKTAITTTETRSILPDTNNDNHGVEGQHLVLRVQLLTGDLALFSHIQVPTHCTLLLPFGLKHKPASTLLQVSFVVFGALPLCYRSVNFMYAYPLLQHGIVASVVATIAYGIWSSRSVARTNQALGIQTALQPRLVAQQSAAWLVLRECATEHLTTAIVEWLVNNQQSCCPCANKNGSHLSLSLLPDAVSQQAKDLPHNQDQNEEMLLQTIASRLIHGWGLVLKHDNGSQQSQPVPLDEAIQRLRQHLW